MNKTTLVLLLREGEVLLSMKKRSFGVGKWNGCGGKLKGGETVRQAAVREMEEEIGVVAQPEDLKLVGKLLFYFKTTTEWNQEVNIFTLTKWQGEPQESEEMRPQWFSYADIPYAEMWPDDQHWLPLVLVGKSVAGEFYFNDDSTGFDKFTLKETLYDSVE